jgi:GNAT superfamily N-acetyltransferase
MAVNVLFVDENYRNKGLGALLLKHGYEIFGVLENCPAGQKRYFMKKIL